MSMSLTSLVYRAKSNTYVQRELGSRKWCIVRNYPHRPKDMLCGLDYHDAYSKLKEERLKMALNLLGCSPITIAKVEKRLEAYIPPTGKSVDHLFHTLKWLALQPDLHLPITVEQRKS
jgi:hypothetical protein